MYTEEGGGSWLGVRKGGMQAQFRMNEGRKGLNVDLGIYRNCQRNCVLGVQGGKGEVANHVIFPRHCQGRRNLSQTEGVC